MKKFLIIIATFVISITMMFCGFGVRNVTFAASVDTQTKIESYLADFMKLNNDVEAAKIQDRRPGTVGEKQAAVNIYNTIMLGSAFSNLSDVNDGSTNAGVQYFQFNNIYTGLSSKSQNLRFIKRSSLSDGKKIIIGTSYDNTPYVAEDKYFDTVSSAANVATLLYIAEYISGLTQELLFDVEIVFFGAGTSNYAGAYSYIDTMTEKEIDNTLLFINLDQILIGQNLYVYSNEVKTSAESYINETFKNVGVKFAEFNSKTTLNSYYSGKFAYSHRGMEGNNIAFMQHDILSINIFSGYYERMGYREEYEGANNIVGTAKDTYTNVDYLYGFDNLGDIASAITGLLVDETAAYNLSKEDKANSSLNFWLNEKYAIMFMVIIGFIFSMLYVYIYYSHKRKAEKIVREKGVSGILRDITRIENGTPDREDNKNE